MENKPCDVAFDIYDRIHSELYRAVKFKIAFNITNSVFYALLVRFPHLKDYLNDDNLFKAMNDESVVIYTRNDVFDTIELSSQIINNMINSINEIKNNEDYNDIIESIEIYTKTIKKIFNKVDGIPLDRILIDESLNDIYRVLIDFADNFTKKLSEMIYSYSKNISKDE